MDKFSIMDWNDRLDQVNNKITLSGSSRPLLTNVHDPHVWSVSDVQNMRDTLNDNTVCAREYEFEEPLTKWAHPLIDELDDAICKCWPGLYSLGWPFTSVNNFEHTESVTKLGYIQSSYHESQGFTPWYNTTWAIPGYKYQIMHATYTRNDTCYDRESGTCVVSNSTNTVAHIDIPNALTGQVSFPDSNVHTFRGSSGSCLLTPTNRCDYTCNGEGTGACNITVSGTFRVGSARELYDLGLYLPATLVYAVEHNVTVSYPGGWGGYMKPDIECVKEEEYP